MELKHINLDQLKTADVNVRKKGGKSVDDLLPSLRALGLLQPLLVRPNCEGYEIVAGQRRFHALQKLAEEGPVAPVACLVMDTSDDAKAIEASLAENIARLPMDEVDQYKAFAALVKEGQSVEEIADHFGITERLVRQRLAIANLIPPVLTAYRKEEIDARTVRALTLATKRQQRDWWRLFKSEDEYAPLGASLKRWLFGGADIAVDNALFDEAHYGGAIITDLFGDERYFDDAAKFWELQNTAIAELKQRYLDDGWQEVVILDVGDRFLLWEHAEVPKTKGGRIYVRVAHDGEVTCHEGYLTRKEADRKQRAEAGTEAQTTAPKAEITKTMQNYLDLHRHAAVRLELLKHPGVALRLAIAQMIAGSNLWDVRADGQRADSEAIGESLKANTAESTFAAERQAVREWLGIDGDGSLVPVTNSPFERPFVHEVFARLLRLDDETVNRIFIFVIAETLPSGDALVEALGVLLKVDLASSWRPDDVFFDLLRDKEAVNAVVKEIAGKTTAEAHTTSATKVQKKIIADCLSGSRKPHKPDWQPRYAAFPMKAYTKRGGIGAVENWKAVKAHYKDTVMA